MSDAGMTRATIRFNEDGTPVVLTSDRGLDQPSTDWERLARMTDDEVEANAASDPDAPLLTDEQLTRLRPVSDVRALRLRLRLTQGQFADRFQIPLGTLRDWEQGRSEPDTTARAFLRVIAHSPNTVVMALKAS